MQKCCGEAATLVMLKDILTGTGGSVEWLALADLYEELGDADFANVIRNGRRGDVVKRASHRIAMVREKDALNDTSTYEELYFTVEMACLANPILASRWAGNEDDVFCDSCGSWAPAGTVEESFCRPCRESVGVSDG